QLDVRLEPTVSGSVKTAGVRAVDDWVSGGFFVFEPGVFEYLEDDATVLESDGLARIARDGELHAYRHAGFWQCMDTPRERDYLEALWCSGCAPWDIAKRNAPAMNQSARRYVDHGAMALAGGS